MPTTIGSGVLSRAAKPRGENCLRAERFSLACQNDKGGLGRFFCQVDIAKTAHGDGVNEVDMARDQGSKCLLGSCGGIFAHQFHVVSHHPVYIWPLI